MAFDIYKLDKRLVRRRYQTCYVLNSTKAFQASYVCAGSGGCGAVMGICALRTTIKHINLHRLGQPIVWSDSDQDMAFAG
eukprot:scaffold226783_cov20-Prasinocladus_malaysianus.AAC.1